LRGRRTRRLYGNDNVAERNRLMMTIQQQCVVSLLQIIQEDGDGFYTTFTMRQVNVTNTRVRINRQTTTSILNTTTIMLDISRSAVTAYVLWWRCQSFA
jgi:hypothetical protein